MQYTIVAPNINIVKHFFDFFGIIFFKIILVDKYALL